MTAHVVRTVLDGLYFGEGPRWHDGSLWFSDMHDHRVVRTDLDGTASTVVTISHDEPSGLGWLPDGRLIFVAMETQRLLRLEHDGSVVEHADLSHIARGSINDMIVAADGTAYVGDMGSRIHDPSSPRVLGQTIRVDPDGTVSCAADDLRSPNGHILSDDGRTLIVAESAGSCLTAFTVAADKSLSDQRTFAKLEPTKPGLAVVPPDGICLDEQGAVWVADPINAVVTRVLEGGTVTDLITFDDVIPVACVLGGTDRRTLLVCVAADWKREAVMQARSGRIDAIDVAVAGAGAAVTVVFDTIVIGAGSAGCVVAARAAARGEQVLLLEAGPDYRADELPDELRTLSLPVTWPHDWRDQVTSIRERGLKYMRGRVTGGSSATNGSVALRAEPPDFDHWPRGWRWPDMLPYFCRIERDLDFGDRPWHGGAGPIPVVRWPRDTWSAMQAGYHDACIAVGFPACADHNEPHTSGIGAIPMNRVQRLRQSNLLVYLEPARANANLVVRGNAHVRRVLIEQQRAVGVELVDGEQLRARDVVLSAGVVQNPLLLWRSGIGPAARVQSLGVESIVDLAHVGFNVTDHLVVSSYAPIDADSLANTVHSIQTILRLSSKDSHRAHDLQLTPFGRRNEHGQAELVQTVALQLPNGAGSITPTSADPAAPPLISWPFAADEDNVRRLREGWRVSLEIAKASGLVTDIGRVDTDLAMSDEDLNELIARDHTAFYHGVGSCRMGVDPSTSVVDQQCAVWNVEGLRIIDASVAPTVPRANTHLLATAIAEHAVDLCA